jgi:tetratricopeptide (TPR) repeat protein
MSTFTVLTVGVSLVFSLQAADWASCQHAASIALQQRNYVKADQLFEECAGLSATREERVTALASSGIALHLGDRNAEAKLALEQALAQWEESGESGRVVTSGVLASVDRSLGDYSGAERTYRAAIGDRSASQGERATLMVNLADLYREEGRDNEARTLMDDASRLTGLTRPQQTGILVETAELTREMRFWDVSIGLWNKVGEIAGSEHSTQLEEAYTAGLGETWCSAGNLARAEPLLRRSLQLLRDDPATSPPQIATALSLLSNLYVREKKLALAKETLDEAISKDEDSLGPEHPQIAVLLEMRANIVSLRGEAQAARDDLERARLIMSAHVGAESSAVAGVFAELGDVEERANQPAAAVLQYGAAMRILRESGPDGMRFGSALVGRYAAALKADHRPEEARALLAANTQSFREK